MISCTRCGTVHVFKYSSSAVGLCTQCQYTVSDETTNLVPYRSFPIPQEYCLDLLNKEVSLGHIKGVITGKLRYFYTEGYLNKWAFCFSGQHLWLCESLGTYFLLKPSQVGRFASDLKPGDAVSHDQTNYTVDAIHKALGYSLEGETPHFDTYFSAFDSIECSMDNEILMIHRSNAGQEIFFTGSHIDFHDIKPLLTK
ncbi:MAG TPA: hypothetical protein VL947_01135 [Cytophagales bacterium]|nr:hypothetical protein [Cytophagales bacterium]